MCRLFLGIEGKAPYVDILNKPRLADLNTWRILLKDQHVEELFFEFVAREGVVVINKFF